MSPDASGNLSFDGLNVNVSGTANTKDSFTVKPVSDVIMNMDLAISDESKLAMASVQNGGESDNPTARNCWICKTPKWWVGIKPSTMRMLSGQYGR
jgi:hypothetical protein